MKKVRAALVDQRFSRLVVRAYANTKNGNAIWECLCDCGNVSYAGTDSLRSGNTNSCGCLGRDRRLAAHKTHGASNTRVYWVWMAMRDRCNDPKNVAFPNYGGRGIKVCERWNSSFENFLADMGPRPEGLTLERINNDGNYEPSNCKWATRKEQSANTRPRRRKQEVAA